MTWDVFCRVIDNYGDIGVCWRLCCELARRGQTVRLWVDDASALRWMAPEGQPGVTVHAWTDPLDLHNITPGEVLVEAFGCDVAPEVVAAFASLTSPTAWINLEYLSAEPYVERSHGLPSPVMSGPGKGLTKHFFYPGFTPQTGGLLREAHLASQQQTFDAQVWLSGQGITPLFGARRISLFCYEPQALSALLDQLQAADQTTQLLVTAGRAQAAVSAWCEAKGLQVPQVDQSVSTGALHLHALPHLKQADYDHLLWACDLNFVRGEDSLVRALWSGKPFVWQIYPQDDNAHHIKLRALLDQLAITGPWRHLFEVWNGLEPSSDWQDLPSSAFSNADPMWAQDDLATRLMSFVQTQLTP